MKKDVNSNDSNQSISFIFFYYQLVGYTIEAVISEKYLFSSRPRPVLK